MAENSKIEWTNHTFNPWMGCTKVSPACANCYAERDFDHRYNKVKWGTNGNRVLTSDANWKLPVKWNKEANDRRECCLECGNLTDRCDYCVRPRIFCASLADVFEDWDGPILNHKGQQLFWSLSRANYESKWHWLDADNSSGDEDAVTMDDVRRRLFELIDVTPNLDWLLLTKRPENIKRMIPTTGCDGDCAKCYKDGSVCRSRPNIWIGCSVENQEQADKRIPELLKCRDLSPVLFLSCEPLLGAVDLRPKAPESYSMLGEFYGKNGFDPGGSSPREDRVLNCFPNIDWVIAGGESGPNARPSHPMWFRSLRDQCRVAGVPFLFKQWGEWAPSDLVMSKDKRRKANPSGNIVGYEFSAPLLGQETLARIGKMAAGRVLDGIVHDGFPTGVHHAEPED